MAVRGFSGKGPAVLFLAATVLWYALLVSGRDGWLSLTAWSLSLAALCFLFPATDRAGGFSRSDWLALGWLTLLAACFRLYRIETLPYGLWTDEVWTTVNATTLFANPAFTPFGTTALSWLHPGGDQQCNLYLVFAGGVQTLFGSGRFGIKMISVLPGILAIPALYVLARALFNRTAALAAAGLLAVSVWHVTLSRWGWSAVLSSTLLVLAFHWVCRGLQRGSCRALVLAGVISGLALYTYLGSRLGVAAVLGFLGLHLLLKRGRLQVRLFSAYLLGLGASILPLIVLWISDPSFFWGRMSKVSILGDLLAGDWSPFFSNLEKCLLMFHFTGDMNPRHHLPGEPMLDVLTGIAFAAGLVIACCTLKRKGSQIGLLWLGFGLLGGVLSLAEEAPNAYRMSLLIPVCCLLSGLALGSLPRNRGGKIVVLLFLAGSLALNFNHYFVERPACRPAWNASRGAEARLLAERLVSFQQRQYRVVLDNRFQSRRLDLELRLQLQGEEADRRVKYLDLAEDPLDLSLLNESGERVALLVGPENLARIQSRVSPNRQEPIQNPFQETLAVVLLFEP